MLFKKKKYEKHLDLIKFESKYRDRINNFLNSNQETRVVFLNADFGWGKTTFIKNNLKVDEQCIYSPWLNPSADYINKIYYHVKKKDKGIISSWVLILTMIFTIASLLLGNIISLLGNIYTSNSTVCKILNYQLVCSQNNELALLISEILKWSIGIIIVLALFIRFKPIPFINFFKKENGQYYEDKIIKSILRKVKNVLVIEDIDRIDDIENVLIVANKISSYIKKHKIKNKYVLLTGDYARVIERITNPNSYNNTDMNLTTYKSKGVFVAEKIISLRIDFCSMQERIDNLLTEYELKPTLIKIEYDEIISFIKAKYISLRFFVRFLEDNQLKIMQGDSIYHLLSNYYFEQKYFNLETSTYDNTLYNLTFFPNCLNDIEMLLQKQKIKLGDKEYKNLDIIMNPKNNSQRITNYFIQLLFRKEHLAIKNFNYFYRNIRYPKVNGDPISHVSSGILVNIGQSLSHNFKSSIDDYLLSYNNTINYGNIIPTKRCYFSTNNNNYDVYKFNQISDNLAKTVHDNEFFYAYFGCFFRKNIDEFTKNYPMLYKTLMQILDEYVEETPEIQSDN